MTDYHAVDLTAEHLYNVTDYWIPILEFDHRGLVFHYFPSLLSQNLRMLAHFRALDRDDD